VDPEYEDPPSDWLDAAITAIAIRSRVRVLLLLILIVFP
jgi:hypothetical protein